MTFRCIQCKLPPIAERWRATTKGTKRHKQVIEGGVIIRMPVKLPAWAAHYAAQGVEQVTRYACPRCKRQLALLAKED